MRIQHNIMAMNAYRNYSNNTSALAKNLEKLSSGYRINRAGDDAAGLAISEKMRAQITALGTAQKNVKDGISLVKTAEGATQEVHDMLNRMVDLATQSANGTYQNEVDREAIESEFNALKTEIDRIADASNFNGITLLDGSLSSKAKPATVTDVKVATKIHDNTGAEVTAVKGKYTLDLSDWKGTAVTAVAATDYVMTLTISDQTIDINVGTKTKGAALTGGDLVTTDTSVSLGGVTFKVTLTGGKLTLENTTADPTTQQEEDFNKVSLTTTCGVNGTLVSGSNAAKDHAFHPDEVLRAARAPQMANAKFTLADADIKDGGTIQIGADTFTFKVNASVTDTGSGLTLNLKGFTEGQAGIAKEVAKLLAQRQKTTDNLFDITTDNQGNIYLAEKAGWTDADYAEYDIRGKLTADNEAPWTRKDGSGIVKIGKPTSSGKALVLQIGEDSEDYNKLTVDIDDMHVAALGLDKHSLSTQEKAQDAVAAIKDAINYVSTTRSSLGATQNRLEHTANNLSTMKENIQDAEATIRDTDIAEEMMAYTKNNILVQSAQAMLAQANQIPQGVLQLLG